MTCNCFLYPTKSEITAMIYCELRWAYIRSSYKRIANHPNLDLKKYLYVSCIRVISLVNQKFSTGLNLLLSCKWKNSIVFYGHNSCVFYARNIGNESWTTPLPFPGDKTPRGHNFLLTKLLQNQPPEENNHASITYIGIAPEAILYN